MASNDSTSLVTIAGITVRTDAAARYSLNDLHQAAGGEKKHQPANFLQLQGTKALVSELEVSSPNSESGSGDPRNGSCDPRNQAPVSSSKVAGTYVVKELVYAYAMWISPAFHLKVIRAYDALVTQPAAAVALPAPDHTPALIALHADQSARKDGHIAELLSQQARLIALLEQRPTATAALPAPSPRPMRPQATHLTVAGRLAMENVQVDAATKRAINNAVLADYRRNNKPFAVTVNGYGLFHIQRIDFHTRRILGMPGGQQQTLEF